MKLTVKSSATQKMQLVRFGDFLVERQLISEAQLLDVLAEHWTSGKRLGDVAVEKGYVTRFDVEALATELTNVSTVWV